MFPSGQAQTSPLARATQIPSRKHAGCPRVSPGHTRPPQIVDFHRCRVRLSLAPSVPSAVPVDCGASEADWIDIDGRDLATFDYRQLIAKQYRKPAPPVLTRFSWLQPRLGCAEFHDVLPPPVRSKCPSCAVPSPLLVQLLHV